jgi:hypothetical protein
LKKFTPKMADNGRNACINSFGKAGASVALC